MKIRLICFVFTSLLSLQVCFGQGEARKYSNEFLQIGVGARAFGMGNAQAAVTDDVTAGYWNPAGLASKDAILYPELSLMHAAYFANIANYNYLGFAMPIDRNGYRRFGISILRVGVDDIPNTLKLVDASGAFNYDAIESFSVSDFAALFSYAWRPKNKENWSFGTNIKVVYRGVGRFGNAWGFGLDAAMLYRTDKFKFGAVLRDATNTFNAWTFNTETFEEDFINTGNIVPQNSLEITRPTLKLALGYEFDLAKRLSLALAADVDWFFDGQRSGLLVSTNAGSLDPHFGIELAYHNNQRRPVAFLRAGAYNLQNAANADGVEEFGLFPTVGLGIVLRNFVLDYALANIGNLSENLHSHVVSLKFHIQ